MRIAATILLLTALSGVVLLLGAVTVLCNLTGEELSADQFERLCAGETHIIFFTNTFWKSCLQPELLPFPIFLRFFEWKAAAIVLPLLALAWLGLRKRTRHFCLAMSVACLVLGIVPYVVGDIMARGASSPSETGPWFAVAILGALYSCLASAAFSASALFAEIWPGAAEAVKRMIARRRHAMCRSIGRN